jgi:CheY-like chemotaxis protein
MVMVVEDHDDLRALLVRTLEASGAFVMSANNAAQALEYISGPPALTR